MNNQEKALLKQKIDRATVVSFDIFDTLLFRKTNTPEIVFDLVGKHFGIHGFRKLRIDAQHEASRRAYAECMAPHADMDEIYGVLSKHTEYDVDWLQVKDFEIQLERDALVANTEMLEMFSYAKNTGKRVVATSDMYLFADTLKTYLSDNGFGGVDYVYCSADERKAKFNKELFAVVAQKENTDYKNILHIGDKQRDDGDYPAEFGMDTFVYSREADTEKIKDAAGSDIDKGIYKILHNPQKGFWYNLGVEAGGPLYMGLYQYLRDKAVRENKKIFFLSRDGYNLYNIFKNYGFENIHYLYISRRALTLASVTELDERALEMLPPYTFGQTVGEILDYLCLDRNKIENLAQAGFNSFDDVISTQQDIDAFKNIYLLNEKTVLQRCRTERENAFEYYKNAGFFDEDAICFDCGWQASSQELVEQFKKAAGIGTKHHFVYFGIKNSDKSRRQTKGMHYDTYLFDFYKNYSLQADLYHNVVMYELFFSAPHESVYYYGENGAVVFEEGNGCGYKEQILEGISDFIKEGLDFAEKYNVEFTAESSVGHLKRLIYLPTEQEAVTIGNLQNVDGFARKQGEEKYIANITKQQLESGTHIELYWPQGLFRRSDIAEDIKIQCAARLGLQYPETVAEYHLEDDMSIRNYHRWIRQQRDKREPEQLLAYNPKFSVVIPVYNTVTEQLEECINSVLAQSYRNFELIMTDDCSSWPNVVPVLKKYESHEKVKVIYRTSNGHISVATNDAIAISDGDFIVFMDCDDTIEPDALYQFAKKLNENNELDFIYSDEDKITEDGKIRHMPFFKPDWSPDLFLNMMYTNHLAAYRASIAKQTGGLRTAYNGSQDYDFTLRFMELSDNSRVGHISKVLYHWRERKESVAFAMTSKNYASEAARYAKEDYIRRNNIDAYLEYITGMSQYRIVYNVQDNPLVSIIIPSKDHPHILRQCIDSIKEFTSYKNYEIVVVDNGSSDKNKAVIAEYLSSENARYIYEKMDFNFSKMCNMGAAAAKGEYLLFLNDDIEIFQPDWLCRMIGHAQQKHTGAVGAKLFYPQTTKIQHTGVSNPADGPLHSFMTYDDQIPYYFGWNRIDNNCICVTGACLMLSAEKFGMAGGFDENLPVAYNDVKLCFELHRKGFYNVIRNDVAAYHHESLSRGNDHIDDSKLIRMHRERTALFADFEELKNKDPYLNCNLSGYSMQLQLKDGYDVLVPVNIGKCTEVHNANVDFINVEDKTIRIIGWSSLDGEAHIEELERCVVFRDVYGRTYKAATLPFYRPDVEAHFGDERYRYSGYECAIRRSDLRIDIMKYQVGVLTVAETAADTCAGAEIQILSARQNTVLLRLTAADLTAL